MNKENQIMSNKFTVRTSSDDGLFIRSAYEAFRASVLESGSTPPSLNEFLCRVIISELHKMYGEGVSNE